MKAHHVSSSIVVGCDEKDVSWKKEKNCRRYSECAVEMVELIFENKPPPKKVRSDS